VFHCNHLPSVKYIVIGVLYTGVLIFGFNKRYWAIYLKIHFFCNSHKYHESKTKRHRLKMLSGSQKRAKARTKKAKAEKEKSTLNKYFNRTTSKNAQKALEEPRHSEDGDNVGRQRGDVMPYGQDATLCTVSEIRHFEIVESDKEESWST